MKKINIYKNAILISVLSVFILKTFKNQIGDFVFNLIIGFLLILSTVALALLLKNKALQQRAIYRFGISFVLVILIFVFHLYY